VLGFAGGTGLGGGEEVTGADATSTLISEGSGSPGASVASGCDANASDPTASCSWVAPALIGELASGAPLAAGLATLGGGGGGGCNAAAPGGGGGMTAAAGGVGTGDGVGVNTSA
jgi:hypothetical protein